jgi:hypothetical protein
LEVKKHDLVEQHQTLVKCNMELQEAQDQIETITMQRNDANACITRFVVVVVVVLVVVVLNSYQHFVYHTD